MGSFQIKAPEKEIFAFRVMDLKKRKDSGQIGDLLVTNQRILYKNRKKVKNLPHNDFNFLLNEIKVNYKKGGLKKSHIQINAMKLPLDMYDPKLVAKWLKRLKKRSKKEKGRPFPVPRVISPFVKKLEQIQHSLAKQSSITTIDSQNYPKKSSLNPSHTSSVSKLSSSSKVSSQNTSLLKKCPRCGAKLNREAVFCVHCGNQIK